MKPSTSLSGSTSSPTDPDPTALPDTPPSSGAAVGGRGGPDDELLIDGQEEVFSRTKVEMGRIEHGAAAGGDDVPVFDPSDDGENPAADPSPKAFPD
jgi:hypothetical protein